ncbi:hypothetical protein KK062_09140 [Fulvivirgaceae bacterium PWU5]|uniref:Lipoprotein n=1 Tax=Dawidia cretensis TaxID=2782350 RepID=A0AAP2GV35_9BACT|nr:hypothetical protein [Dawidia cretensis]MBT1708387.1 hypothetical protein [Dawidia cretensis]
MICPRKKEFTITGFIIGIILSSCVRSPNEHTGNDLYSQVLDELVTHRFIFSCTSLSKEHADELNTRYRRYFDGEIDSIDYFKFERTITNSLKDTVTCTFDLSGDFGVGYRIAGLSQELVDLIHEDIGATHIDSFLGVSVDQIADSLTVPSKKKASEFQVDYINIVPYKKTSSRGFLHDMKGNGIFTFSAACLSKDGTRAAIYYEYMCGTKCGSGEIVLLQLIEGRWKIIRAVKRWDS